MDEVSIIIDIRVALIKPVGVSIERVPA